MGSFTASESRWKSTIGSPLFALAASAVGPKFMKISGPAGSAIRFTSNIPNAAW
jgi:hypothetical protein